MAGWTDGREGGGGWRRGSGRSHAVGMGVGAVQRVDSCKFSGGAEGFGGVGSAAPSPSTAESLVWSAAKTSSAAATCAKCQSRRQEAGQRVGTGSGEARNAEGRAPRGQSSTALGLGTSGHLQLGIRAKISTCQARPQQLGNPPIPPLEPQCCPCPEQRWSAYPVGTTWNLKSPPRTRPTIG